ncbi:MAG: hypothetical protein J5854_04550 [Clostridia bacterium]|nr:hypothetical protein [Clostridia bacterium]
MCDQARNKALSERICRVSFRGGRRLPAFVFDCVFLSAAAFSGAYLAVRPHFANRTAALTVSFVTLALGALVFIAVRRALFEKHRANMRRAAREELIDLKLVMEPDPFGSSAGSDRRVYVSRSIDALSADEVKAAYLSSEKPLTIVAFSKPTEAAERLLSELPDVSVKTPRDHLGEKAAESIRIEESEIDARIVRKHGSICRRPRIKKELFALSKERAVKYILLGGVLMLMSFFMRYAVYYRTLASITLTAGASVFAVDAYGKGNKKTAR